jgi:hypothetical protein
MLLPAIRLFELSPRYYRPVRLPINNAGDVCGAAIRRVSNRRRDAQRTTGEWQ